MLLGTATKAQDIIPCHDKKYLADFRFGIATDTLDIWGKVTEEKPAEITRAALEEALGAFRGTIEQLPPMYSAVSVDGKRLYRYAREGKTVERKPRSVTVYALTLEAFDEDTQSGTLNIYCSNGTYVRAIIDDLARSLGTVGVMTDLVRTQACSYRLDDCMTLDALKAKIESGDSSYLRSVESIFLSYDALVVSDKQAHRFVNGNPLDIARTALKNHAEDKKIYRVKDQAGTFLSLGIVDGDSIKMFKHF